MAELRFSPSFDTKTHVLPPTAVAVWCQLKSWWKPEQSKHLLPTFPQHPLSQKEDSELRDQELPLLKSALMLRVFLQSLMVPSGPQKFSKFEKIQKLLPKLKEQLFTLNSENSATVR